MKKSTQFFLICLIALLVLGVGAASLSKSAKLWGAKTSIYSLPGSLPGGRSPTVLPAGKLRRQTGVTVTRKVPFSKESMSVTEERDKKLPKLAPRAVPFTEIPPPEKLISTPPTSLRPSGKLFGQVAEAALAPLLKSNSSGIDGIGVADVAELLSEQSESALAPALESTFTGIDDNNTRFPPDTHGAAGPSHLVETLNSEVAFFDKSTGTSLSRVSLQGFWSALGTGPTQPANFPFDPKVIYDQYSGRFIVVTMGGTSSPNSWLLIAVSATSDPTGVWYRWAIDADLDGGVQSYENWADYPGIGVDAGNLYFTAVMLTNTPRVYQYSKVWVLPKEQLLGSQGGITWTEFRDPPVSGPFIQPAHVFGASSAEYLINENYVIDGTPPQRFFMVNRIDFPGGVPTWANLGYIEVDSYPTSIPNAPQLGSTQTIETNNARLLNAVYRDGRIWTTHHVSNEENTKTEVAWYEIDPAEAGWPAGIPIQQGRISDPSRSYYYPSIAVNARDDAGIGFSGSSAGEYASAYYTAMLSTEATMQPVALLKAGLAPYYKTATWTVPPDPRNRWGDYSATVVDPSDSLKFWTLQEYAETPVAGTDRWGTWWGSFVISSDSTLNPASFRTVLGPGVSSWDINGAGTPFVLKENGIYKIWYSANSAALPDVRNPYNFNPKIEYAESSEGINWTNRQLVHSNGAGYLSTFSPWVMKEDGIYKMWHTDYYKWLGGDWSAYVSIITSIDGITWSGNQQVLAGSGNFSNFDDYQTGGQSLVRETDGSYSMWYNVAQRQSVGVGGPFRISRATSPDGINWSDKRLVLDITNTPENSVSNPDVVKEPNGTYTMYYVAGGQDRFSVGSAIYRAKSPDGVNWTNREQILNRNQLGAEILGLGAPNYFKDTDGKEYLYFSYSRLASGMMQFIGRVSLGYYSDDSNPNSVYNIFMGAGQTVSITTPGDTVLQNVAANPSATNISGIRFPFGTFSFEISNVTPGGSVSVDLDFTSPLPASLALYKIDNSGNVTLIPTSLYTVNSGRTRITLTLTDGGTFDLDGSANGIIVDPIGIWGGSPPTGANNAAIAVLGLFGLISGAMLLIRKPFTVKR